MLKNEFPKWHLKDYVFFCRENLDLLNQYTDEQIWRALEMAQLSDFVQQLPSKLGKNSTLFLYTHSQFVKILLGLLVQKRNLALLTSQNC